MILKLLHEVSNETGDPEAELHREEVLRLNYYRDNERRRSGFRFHGVGATRTRSYRFTPAWMDGAYYKLVEVEDSPWLKELLEDVEPNDLVAMRGKHHYAFLTKDSGGFELIADSWELIPEDRGWWPD